MYQKSSWAAACVGLSLAVLGCNPAPKLPTIAASGTVKYKGEPVANAQVGFYPANKDSGKSAVGTTDAAGHFSLQTLVGGTTYSPGALAGDYNVSVVKSKTAYSAEANKNMTPEEAQKKMAEMSKPPSGDSKSLDPSQVQKQQSETTELPGKYAAPATSGLTASVKQGDKNEFTFDLTD